jgi:hypothetical protein
VQLSFGNRLFGASRMSTGIYAIDLSTEGLAGGFYSVAASAFKDGYMNGFDSEGLEVTSATVVFCVDPRSGSVTVDGLTRVDGTSVDYVSGVRVHVVANPPPAGAAFAYWEASGVTVEDRYARDTYVTVIGSGWLKAHFVGVPLSAGWNLVSLPVVPKDSSITRVLAAQIAANEITIVWSYTGTPRTWKLFTPGKSSTLTSMTDGNGYWIYMRTSDTVYIDGSVIAPVSTPPTYSLVQGWNLIGFKPEPTVQSETVGAYLSSISGTYDPRNIWIYDNPNGTWIRATDSTMLQPGQAMWIYVTSTTATTLRP